MHCILRTLLLFVLLAAAGFAQAPDFAETKKKAEAGDANAQDNLGSMYAKGEGVLKDYAEAVKWFRKAADQGHADAQKSLGNKYYNGQGVPKNYAEAMSWWRKAADQGDANAQYNLGTMYGNGRGVPKDYAEAFKWFRLAAEQGLAVAQNNLGRMYDKGEGVPKDNAEAMKWYRKAAEQGNAKAQNELGLMYGNGVVVPKDEAESKKWFRKAADQGHAEAQFYLGLIYVRGFGVPKDNAEALKWFRLAAEQGYSDAQYNVGLIYLRGLGVLKDEAESIKWFRLAADQGHTKAQQILADLRRLQEASARQKPAKDQHVKSTDGVAKLVIKGLAIGMSIDAALEVVNERLSDVLNQKYGVKRSDTSGAYLSPVSDSSPQEINQYNGGLVMLSLLSNLENGIGTSIGLPLSFSVECEVNNDAVTRIVLPAKLTNALFNTADMQASDFLLQIRKNYHVGVKEGDWTVFQFYKAETNWTGWEYSSPEGYRIRVFDSKAIEMKKIPKSNERSFN